MHDELEFIWVLRGWVKINCENKEYRAGNRDFFVVNPYQLHSIKTEQDTVIIAFRFKNDYLERNRMSFNGMRFTNRVYPLSELLQKYQEIPVIIKQLIQLLLDDDNTGHIRYKIIGYYNILLYELYNLLLKEKYLDIKKKNVSLHLKRLSRITDYISLNYQRNINLDELTRLLNISRFRLSHFIKEYLGISFREYLMNMRLEHAMGLLRNSDLPVKEVSIQSGFSDIKYLNQSMKNRFNITALKYRKRIQAHRNKLKQDPDERKTFINELRICLRDYGDRN